MTDLEIVRLCADAMGWHTGSLASKVVAYPVSGCAIIAGNAQGGESVYDPLHDDAQAMQLVKKLHLHIGYNQVNHCRYVDIVCAWVTAFLDRSRFDADLNRAICLCVAKMQSAK